MANQVLVNVKDIKRNMGNHISEINQNKGCDTWFKDAF